VKYWGQAKCLGFDVVVRPDVAGSNRKAFVFHLYLSAGLVKDVQQPKPNYTAPLIKQLKKRSLDELRFAALESSLSNATSQQKNNSLIIVLRH